jgi:hypothetical protein
MFFRVVVLLALTLASCTTAIRLQNPTTGQTAQCGPYASDIIAGGDAQAQRERACVQDFQRQGYERLP